MKQKTSRGGLCPPLEATFYESGSSQKVENDEEYQSVDPAAGEQAADTPDGIPECVLYGVTREVQPGGNFLVGKPFYPAHNEYETAAGRQFGDDFVEYLLDFLVKNRKVRSGGLCLAHGLADHIPEFLLPGGQLQEIDRLILCHPEKKAVQVTDPGEPLPSRPQLYEDISGYLLGYLGRLGNLNKIMIQMIPVMIEDYAKGLLVTCSDLPQQFRLIV